MILAIDQGTTGTTALAIDDSLSLSAKSNVEYPQIYPQPGWVEHDPEAIWDSVRQSVSNVFNELGWDQAMAKDRIRAIGITNQRETLLFWDRNTGKPVHNALVWQCRRTADFCARLIKEGKQSAVTEATGLLLDPYFSGSKAKWLLDNIEGLTARAYAGEIAFGTIETFLIHRLTGEHVTEISNASRTLLMNINTGAWDPFLLETFSTPEAVLPKIASSAQVYGKTRGLGFIPDGIPVSGCAGDQQAALFGQRCFEKATAKATFGTGSFILMNTGLVRPRSANRLLGTIGWRLSEKDPIVYALEGSVFIAGAAVQWLRDGLNIIKNAQEIEPLANSVPDSGGVHFVPALTGLGAPHWDAEARGTITGLTRGTTTAHLARATLEAIAFQNAEVLEAMEKDLGEKLAILKVDGGAAANDLLMQMQADLLGVPLERPKMLETTALGAAMLAGLGAGIFKTTDELKSIAQPERVFEPNMGADQRESMMAGWRKAVAKARG